MSVEKIKRSEAAAKRRADARAAAAAAVKEQSKPETIKLAKAKVEVREVEPKLSKAERKKQHAEMVAEQAARDAMAKSSIYEDDVQPGEKLTLHQLNMRAKAISRASRDTATSIGRQIGRQTRDLIITNDERRRTGPGQRSPDAKIAALQQPTQE